MSTLLLITGAGASFDSINEELVPDETVVFRPPLTVDLFPFHSIIGAPIDPHSLECLKSHPIASQIGYNLFLRFRNKKNEMNLEQYLAELKNSKVKTQRSQFWAVPLYLFELFMNISQNYTISKTPGLPSNYKSLLDRLNESHYTQTIWLNLNYDLLADFAIKHSVVNKLENLNDYMLLETPDSKKIKYIKPHGSIDWFKQISDSRVSLEDVRLGKTPNDFENLMSDEVVKAKVDIEGIITARPSNGYPAITAPIGEYVFVCRRHIDAIIFDLRNTTDMLCIGFSALDKDILELIRNNVEKITKLKIVNGNKESAQQAYARLKEHCGDKISLSDDCIFDGGFTTFIQSGIKEFLEI